MTRLALLGALFLVLAAPAAAENRVVPVFGGQPPTRVDGDDLVPVLDGPFLSGEDVVFTERRLGRLAIVADGPRGRRDLDVSTTEPGPEPLEFDLDVAEGRLALTSWHFTCRGDLNCSRYDAGVPDHFTTLLGPVDGPFRRLDTSCGTATADVAATAFAGVCMISGGRELHEEGGAAPRKLEGNVFLPPQVAGDFAAEAVASGSATGIRVLRRPGLEEAYRVDAPIRAYDLLPDGALAYGVRGTPDVGWSSPADPAVHRLPVGAEVLGVAAAGERIATRAEGGRMKVIDRAGATVAEVTDPAAIASFDYDGTRLAWARRPCSRMSIVVWDLAQPQPALAGNDCTMPGHGTGRLRLGVNRRVVVTITCPAAAPEGCAGVTGLSVYLRRRAGARPFLRGSTAESFDLLAGESARIRVRVSRKRLRSFRRGHVVIETTLLRSGQDQLTRRPLRLR